MDTNLQAIGVSASYSSGNVFTLLSNSINTSAYRRSQSSGSTETIELPVAANGTQTMRVSGTPTYPSTVSVAVYDSGLSNGSRTVTYPIGSSDTLQNIATGIASAINGDSVLSTLGVSAAAIASNAGSSFTQGIVNVTSTSLNNTSYAASTTSGASYVVAIGNASFASGAAVNSVNEITQLNAGGNVRFQGSAATPALVANDNGVQSGAVNVPQTAAITASSSSTTDVLWINVHDNGLSQAETVKFSPAHNGDSASTIAAGMTSAINADSTLTSLGVTASANGAVITLYSTSPNPTSYTQAVTSGSEVIALGIATGSQLGVSPSTLQFSANPQLASGTNIATLTAINGAGTKTSKSYALNLNSPASQSLTYDDDGNWTNGSSIYPQMTYDAEHRLIKIQYDSSGNNHTDFTFDPLGNRAKILETTSGSVSSTQQFVFDGAAMREQRDGSGNLITQYFPQGYTNSGNSNYYKLDHLGNVREVWGPSGLVCQIGYTPYGIPTLIQGSSLPDICFAGLLNHPRSQFYLSATRAYSASLGADLSPETRLGKPVGSISMRTPEIIPLALLTRWG